MRYAIAAVMALLLMLAVYGCDGASPGLVSPEPETPEVSGTPEPDGPAEEADMILRFVIYGIEDDTLLVCEANNPAALYTVNTSGVEEQDYRLVGSVIDVETEGVRESYPAHCDAKAIRVAEYGSDNCIAGAYLSVFNYLYENAPGLNGEVGYLAIDLSGSQIPGTAKTVLLASLYSFCLQNALTLAEDTFEGLEEKGLIKDSYFEDGILIIFDDVSVKDNELKTRAQKWRSGLGAIGASFTVSLKSGSWDLLVEESWIS